MEKTWKPVAGGICGILAGAYGVLGGGLFGVMGAWWPMMMPHMTSWGGGWLGLLGWPLFVLGVLAVIGGIFAIQRKRWGLALGGAICAALILPALILGVLAVIFIAISRGEFEA